jgi:hypothetical protein
LPTFQLPGCQDQTLQEISRISSLHLSSSLADLLKNLDISGLRTLLGLSTTVGTLPYALPPPITALLDSFQLPHFGPPSRLTVGARALAKHAHRSAFFGGDLTGTEDAKNSRAFEIINHILSTAVWINCHALPHNTFVCEFRVDTGHGARWSLDGSVFRGFLEPWMKDGHDKKWRSQ